MEDTHFKYAVNDDKSKLTVVLHEATLEYTADEVGKLAVFFANLRAEMTPSAPARSSLEKSDVQCDLYEVFQNPEDGTTQIYLRIPGLFWTWIQFSKEQSLRLSETLNPPTTAPSNVTFN